jgi:Biotin carboxylase, N-terminal domain
VAKFHSLTREEFCQSDLATTKAEARVLPLRDQSGVKVCCSCAIRLILLVVVINIDLLNIYVVFEVMSEIEVDEHHNVVIHDGINNRRTIDQNKEGVEGISQRDHRRFDSVSSYVKELGGAQSRVIEKVLIANNGVAAVKAIRSIRRWAYDLFGNERAIQFVVMATPEDLRYVLVFLFVNSLHVHAHQKPF